MTALPISFSAPEILALRDGRKTQARLIIEDASLLEPSAQVPFSPGTQLWVLEEWATDAQVDGIDPQELSQGEPIFYPATGHWHSTGCSPLSKGRDRAAIDMPIWASRLMLTVTDVRIQRLQDISEEDAIAEGLRCHPMAAFDLQRGGYAPGYSVDLPDGRSISAAGMGARPVFRDFWDSQNAEPRFKWAQNPWVMALTFETHAFASNANTTKERTAA